MKMEFHEKRKTNLAVTDGYCFFFALSYKVKGAKQYARILLKRARARSIDEYQWRVFRVSNISIALDGDIESFQRISQFHDSNNAKVTRNNSPGAQLYLLQRATFEIQ